MNFPFRLLSYRRYCNLKRKSGDIIAALGGEVAGEEPQILQLPALDRLDEIGPFAVLDVGANSGAWAMAFASRFPQSRIHCIEADPRTYGQLQDNLARRDDIIPYNLACSSHDGELAFYSHENSLLSSLLDLPGTGGMTTAMRVPSVTVDNFISAHATEPPALIKIDTEGADLDVLRGSNVALRSAELAFVILEFGINDEDARHVQLNRLIDFMGGYGFCLSGVAGFGLYENYLYANALFARHPASESA